MNNRKPKNKRGALSRQQFTQLAPEPEKIRFYVGEGEEKKLIEIPNPKYGRQRRIVHNITKKNGQ